MSLLPEMENNSTEDDYADSGADTAGSDYSPMSSSSSDLSLGDLQDPFLVSIHIITDPGQAKTLQCAADQVLSWLHPKLTLFRVSERACGLPIQSKLWQKSPKDVAVFQPALAVILFLQVEYGGEENLEHIHAQLRRPPWHYHHTERVNGHGLLPYSSASQDFFTLAAGTPLWALRQVHYGKEVVRFTVYCQHETYSEQVRLYRLLLQRRLAQKKEDFCFCVVYSSHDMEIQLSFKQLPRGQSPTPTECAIMEIRVRDVGGLVPLLPNPCTPISDIRWQTEDYDGNRILLQVQGSWKQHRQPITQFSHVPPDSSSVKYFPHNTCPTKSSSHQNRRNRHSSRSRTLNSSRLNVSQASLPLVCEQEDLENSNCDVEIARAGWMGLRTHSLFSLPTEGSGSAGAFRPRSSSVVGVPMYRINVDTLVGAQETDVDTGQAVSGSSVDLSVVSAYSRPKTQGHFKVQLQRPLSAPPQDVGSDLPQLPNNYTSSSLTRTPVAQGTKRTFSKSAPCTTSRHSPKNVCTLAEQVHTLAGEEHQLSNCNNKDSTEDGTEEEEEEFYI